MKRVIAGLIALLFLLTSCSVQSETTLGSQGGRNQTISASVGAQLSTLDPQMSVEADTVTYALHLFEGLMRPCEDGVGFTWGVAQSYTVSQDGCVYTYDLRADAVWSDGRSVVADDFVYAWRRLFSYGSQSPYAYDISWDILGAFELLSGQTDDPKRLGVRALDDRTLEVTLNAPCGYIDELMAMPTLAPLRSDVVERSGGAWAQSAQDFVSNGAFVLESWDAGEELSLVRSRHYWDHKRILPAGIHFKLLGDENAAAASVRSGQLDYSSIFPSDQRNALADEGLLCVQPLTGTYFISFSQQTAPFNNAFVRQAFSLAIDRQALQELLKDEGVVAADALIGPGYEELDGATPFYSAGAYGELFDAQAARQALANAGYAGGRGFPAVQMIVTTEDAQKGIADYLQQQWQDVLGVTVQMYTCTMMEAVEIRMTGEYDLARSTFISQFHDVEFFLLHYETGGAVNDVGFSSEAYDNQLATAGLFDQVHRRSAALHRAQDILMENTVVAPMFFYTQQYLRTPNLCGTCTMDKGGVLFHTAYIEQ